MQTFTKEQIATTLDLAVGIAAKQENVVDAIYEAARNLLGEPATVRGWTPSSGLGLEARRAFKAAAGIPADQHEDDALLDQAATLAALRAAAKAVRS
jgi:hypothetical protein